MFEVPTEASQQLAALASRNLRLQVLVQEGVVQVMGEEAVVELELGQLGGAPASG